MANTEGIAMKYVVLKNEDIEKALTVTGQEKLQYLLDTISVYRKEQLDKGDNTYVVVNTDEPYADEVIEIMKRHGHWG